MPRLLGSLGISLAVVLVLAVLVSLVPGQVFRPIEGARIFDRVSVCPFGGSGCQPGQSPAPAALPFHLRSDHGDGIHMARFTLDFARTGPADGVTAVFLPRFSDAISISVNGDRLTPAPWLSGDGRNFHHWHRPFIATLPNAGLKPQGNVLAIDLAADGFQDISLYPLYVGDAAALDFAFQLAGIARVGSARVNFSLVMLAGSALLIFWVMHRRDMIYFWLAAASLASAVVCYHWVYPNLITNYRSWITFWNFAAAFQIWCTLSFVCILLEAPCRRFRLVAIALLAAGAAGLCLLHPDVFRLGLAVYQLGFLLLTLLMLSTLVLHRSATPALNFGVLFGLYALALALAFGQWISRHILPDWAPALTSTLIPVVFILSLLWVIFFQLARSIARYENLLAALQSTINDKTAELQATYSRIARQDKIQAIDEERQRILLDLHDGIGGQLVNMLAYMSTQPKQDKVLETAIEDALRDMGLMIDSLEAGDSIATQLGLLRGRLEPLFARHHVDLAWQIEADPHLPGAGPSQNLTLLRIVQEAITNAVRHAQASRITIAASCQSISVTDNGSGFEPSSPERRSAESGGIGLTGMHRRARAIGAELIIESSTAGTRVDLSWDRPWGNAPAS
ncbi:MAG: hypothetical protein CML68_19490 [Rhodobacteraceae bacterium]|nr:hypothetical protein [Paracoccaceae bacterium]